MAHPKVANFEGLLAALKDGQVEFIVIGGAAAVLHGAPTTTLDLDIVHRRTPENVARLMAVLENLDATVREVGNRGLRPRRDDLEGRGQVLLSTALGPLDALCVLHDGRGFEELLPLTEELADGPLRIRVIGLDALIDIKRATGRAKDRLMLPLLIAAKAARRPP